MLFWSILGVVAVILVAANVHLYYHFSKIEREKLHECSVIPFTQERRYP